MEIFICFFNFVIKETNLIKNQNYVIIRYLMATHLTKVDGKTILSKSKLEDWNVGSICLTGKSSNDCIRDL